MRKPMQSWYKISLIAFLIICSYLLYNKYLTCTEYIPMYFNGNAYFESRDSVNELLKKNIQKVFAAHDVQYKVVDGNVFYKGSIEEDMLLNYTKKANDSAWLNYPRKYY